MVKIRPKRWADVYPQGTPEGDEEARLFKSLARHPKYDWRSTAALANESGLSHKRVEEIVSKYLKLNMVFQNPKNEEEWAYWERVPGMIPEQYMSASDVDKERRIGKASKRP